MATFKTASHVALAIANPTSVGTTTAAQNEQENNRVTVASKPKRTRKRQRSREKSIELIVTNGGINEGPSIYQLAAEGKLEELKHLIEITGFTLKEKDENGATLLHHAAANNQIIVIQYLIESGINLEAADSEGNTALHLACDKGHVNSIQLLLKSGARDTALNKAFDAPLHIIVRHNDTDTLEAFLDFPVDILVKGYRGRTALHVISENDNVEACEVFSRVIKTNDHFKSITGFRMCAQDDDELTPLHLAARSGSHKVLDFSIRQCVSHGYDVAKVLSFLDEENSTPLHAAVDCGHLKVVEVLLKHKADPSESKDKQISPFLLASTQGKLEMMQLMVRYGGKEIVHCRDTYGQSALHRCAHAINSAEIICFLAENGAEIDAVDNDGRTPLMVSIKSGALGSVRVLLCKGANAFVRDVKGLNPLHYIVKHKRKAIMRVLLEVPNSSELATECDSKGDSPIHYALRMGQNDMVSLMIVSAAQQLKTIKDVNGNNYLHLAAESGDWKALEILLDSPECQKLLNQTNKYGGTPLHLAAGGGHVKAVQILLSSGAMVHRCYCGNTPFQFACARGKPEVAKLTFEAHPFQLAWTNDIGENALHMAAAAGCPKTLQYLLDIGVPVVISECGETFFDRILASTNVKCAMAVVNHERWQECLDVVSPEKDHPMISLIQSMPEVAKTVLDRCHTKADVPPEVRGYWETYDFKYLRLKTSPEDRKYSMDDEKAKLLDEDNDHMMAAPSIQYKGSKKSSSALYHPRTAHTHNHLEVLRNMVKYNRVPLLTHPVTENYLKSKWRNYGRFVQLVKMIVIVLQIVFLIAFTFLAPSAEEMRNSCSSNCTENQTTIVFSTGATATRFITIGFTSINLFHWLVTVIRLGVLETLNLSRNTFVLIDILSIICTYVFVIPWNSLDSVIWEAGALASFLTWLSFVLTIQLFDLFGVYVTMLLAITRTVFQVLLICLVFIIAFGMSLYILASNVQEFSTFGYSLFTNFGHLLGEIDYVYFIEKDANGELYFSTLTFMFVIIIAILMAIVIQNLLIGLAVGDIELIKQNAIAQTRAIEIGFYKRVDFLFPSKLFWKLDQGKYTRFPNKKVLGIRLVWKYIWKSIKGEDPSNNDDSNDSEQSGGDQAWHADIANINDRIDELTLRQEKVLDLLTQILTTQEETKQKLLAISENTAADQDSD